VSTERPRVPTARLAASIIGVVLVAFVVLLWVSDPGGDQGRRAIVGRPAPAVVGEGLEGEQVSLADMEGRWVVVNFFATWCPPCIEEHPELVAFAERHADGRAVVLGLGFEDDPEAIEAFFDQRGGDWPVIARGTGPMALSFGVRKMPESYLVAPDGTVVDVFIAGVGADQLDEAIAANGGIDLARPGAAA
jgi:cytochrome c biogenesis protein CcmG/thiol:disulfide interchange protein DsbE